MLVDPIDMLTGTIFKIMLWAHLLTLTFAQGMQELESSEIILLTQMEDMD